MSDRDPLVIHAAADGHLHMLSPLVICDGEVDWPEIEGIQATDDRAYLRARYVHGGLPANGNGHIFRTEHLVTAHRALPHTYLNWLHRSNHTVGCFTATRLVDEATGVVLDRRSEYTDTPYVEALAAMWRLAYPDEYRAVRVAYDAGMGFLSCEAYPSHNTCPTCGSTYEWEGYTSDSYCDHLNKRMAPRWLENPTFIGGAVVVPPSRPGWKDAAITRIADWMGSDSDGAGDLFSQVAAVAPHLSHLDLEAMMGVIIQNISPELTTTDRAALVAPGWEWLGKASPTPPKAVAAAAAAAVVAADAMRADDMDLMMSLARQEPQSPSTVRALAATLAALRVDGGPAFDHMGGEVVAEWSSVMLDAQSRGVDGGEQVAIVIRPSAEVVDTLSRNGIEPDQVHVTVLYLGRAEGGQIGELGKDEVVGVVASVASGRRPLVASLTGQGFFPSEGGVVAWAAIDCQGLEGLHVELADAFTRVECAPQSTHGFIPHATFAYLNEGDPIPVVETGATFDVTEVEVWWGNERVSVPF